MKIGNLIVYDIETGGFSKVKNGLAEIAMIAYDIVTLEELDRYEAIIQPYENHEGDRVTYSPEALKVNGLTLRKIEAGLPAKQVVTELMAFAKKHKRGTKKPILIGHNIEKFDNPWIDYFFSLFKKDVSKIYENWCIDSMWWSALKWPETGEGHELLDHKLSTVSQAMGVKHSNAHSAMPDVEANAAVVIQFLRGLRGDLSDNISTVQKKEKKRIDFKF